MNPEGIKIVHFSGDPTAKPWCRVLDPDGSWWPRRSDRDASYVVKFAETFRGYWLWVKKDPDMWASASRSAFAWDTASFELGSDGQIYRRPPDSGTKFDEREL